MRLRSPATRIAAGPRSTPATLAPKPQGAPMMLTRRPPPGPRIAFVSARSSRSPLIRVQPNSVCARSAVRVYVDNHTVARVSAAEVYVPAAAPAALRWEEGLH